MKLCVYPSMSLSPTSSPNPFFTACPEIDALKGRIREHEARKPVVLMFPAQSFHLPSRQLSLISAFVNDC